MNRLVLLLMLGVFSMDAALGAKVSMGKFFKDARRNALYVEGEITAGDYRKVVNAILKAGVIPGGLQIQSPGGDVMEAIKIGRLVRSALIPVWSVKTCNSACTFIWFAGIARLPGLSGVKLGIHRPYYEKRYFAGLSMEEARKEYERLEHEVYAYLYEMKVPTSVIEKMMSVPSDGVFWLTEKEYSELAGHYAPAYEEWIKARCPNALSDGEFEDLKDITDVLDYYDHLLKRGATDWAKGWEDDARSIRQRMSPGYIEYVRNKAKEHNECTEKAVGAERAKYFKKLEREYKWVAASAPVPLNPPFEILCANSPSDGSRILWLVIKPEKEPIYLGLSLDDRRPWRWVYAENREIQPATSEEAKELEEAYRDADLSQFVKAKCQAPR